MGKRGPKGMQPTKKQKADVLRRSGYGVPQTVIATDLGISLPTLHKHFRAELDNGKTALDEIAVGQLFKNILAGKEASTMFYLKCRCGWKEPPKAVDVAHSGSIGGFDPSKLTDAELDRIEARTRDALASAGLGSAVNDLDGDSQEED